MENILFENDVVTIVIWFPYQSFPQTLLQCSVDAKHLIRFQSETSVFKFLRLSVDGDLFSQLKIMRCILKKTSVNNRGN